MIGEYVTCNTNIVSDLFGYMYLTKGKKYQIVDIDNLEIMIIDDMNNHNFFPIWMFKTIQNLREEKLNELGI
jgi:hypothetical protein